MLDNPDLQQIAATGALAPWSDFKISTDNFAEGVLSAGTYKDKVYGLAPPSTRIALFYNKDILAKAGVTPPTTWDELKAAAAKLTSGDQYGLAFNANPTYEGTWQFLPVMWSNGGDEKKIDTKETEQALQLWTDLVKNGSVSSSALNWTQADVKDQFMAGKAAMMVNGPWQIPSLDKQPALQYGVVKIPVREAGQTSVAPLGGEVWTVPQTGNKDPPGQGGGSGCLPEQRRKPAGHGQGPQHHSVQDHVREVRRREPQARHVHRAGQDRPCPHRRARRRMAGAGHHDLHRHPDALTGNASPADALKQAQGQ